MGGWLWRGVSQPLWWCKYLSWPAWWLWCIHLSKLIRLYISSGHSLFHANYTSVKYIFKMGPWMANFNHHFTCEGTDPKLAPSHPALGAGLQSQAELHGPFFSFLRDIWLSSKLYSSQRRSPEAWRAKETFPRPPQVAESQAVFSGSKSRVLCTTRSSRPSLKPCSRF